ncbi:helix-turn-helix transcriptional regulator [Bacillus sp. BRMEA1]|uniref:helix-turn-helix domain-containing protein n=1 Tax=Neobacillus endophyticus TaxID=2738405 RepID=UPI001567ABBD|nr:helix-turn-helix transcriptional regulator [Neobacillus endophyticus]NRD77376.1 helix-turn-helix transcriptional regulator [Neobacillus endophyticus]
MDWKLKEVGMRIKQLRKEFNKTANEIVEAIHISQPYYSQIENGHVPVSIENLIKICDFYGITLSEFFDDNFDEDLKKLLSTAKKLNKEQLEALQKFLDTFCKNG